VKKKYTTIQTIRTVLTYTQLEKAMTIRNPLPILMLLTSLTLAACGGPAKPTATVEPVTITRPTPDPCAPENLPEEVEKIHRVMREFDDESLLASNTPVDGLNPSISTLQRIRREAEDQPVPACLVRLKGLQLAHMSTVINTLLGFLSGSDQTALNQSVALARQQHDEYALELANLLGLTVIAPTVTTPIPGASEGELPSFQGEPVLVFNPGPAAVNLRAQPDLNAEYLGILDIGATTMAVGRNADGSWIEIAVPDQPGVTVWVFTGLIQLSGSPDALPVTSP
jgi:hypothetical protein